jgi:hypothetical protein
MQLGRTFRKLPNTVLGVLRHDSLFGWLRRSNRPSVGFSSPRPFFNRHQKAFYRQPLLLTTVHKVDANTFVHKPDDPASERNTHGFRRACTFRVGHVMVARGFCHAVLVC